MTNLRYRLNGTFDQNAEADEGTEDEDDSSKGNKAKKAGKK